MSLNRSAHGLRTCWVVLALIFVSCGHHDSSQEVVSSPLIPPMSPKVPGTLVLFEVQHAQVPEHVGSEEAVVLIDGELNATYHVSERTEGEIFVTNMNGELVKMLHRGRLRAGKQVFSFTNEPLPIGEYMFYVCYPNREDTIVAAHFMKR